MTQILGGYLSDKWGPERVLLTAGLGWALITFWFHALMSLEIGFAFIVLARVALGACQGVHFPAMASLSSQNLNVKDRGFFFSAVTAGGALGTVLTGTVGSAVNETFGWPSVFYAIGFFCLVWVLVLKRYAIDQGRKKHVVLGTAPNAALMGNKPVENVPWLSYLRHKSLWACVVCHFCQNNCFFILLSWLPTYFHDNFPLAKGWIFNVVPWLLMVPGIAFANWVTGKLLQSGVSIGNTRKIVEGICMGTEAVCLIIIGKHH